MCTRIKLIQIKIGWVHPIHSHQRHESQRLFQNNTGSILHWTLSLGFLLASLVAFSRQLFSVSSVSRSAAVQFLAHPQSHRDSASWTARFMPSGRPPHGWVRLEVMHGHPDVSQTLGVTGVMGTERVLHTAMNWGVSCHFLPTVTRKPSQSEASLYQYLPPLANPY